MVDIKAAEKDVNELYDYLSVVARDIVAEKSKQLDSMIAILGNQIETFNNEQLRNMMAKISIEAYNLSMYKEQSSLKESCATALYKEGIATAFNNSTGTVESRKNISTIKNMDKQAVSILYSSVSQLLKAKTDEAHRVASIINGILISRSAEAKLQYNPRSEDYNSEPFAEI